MYFVIFLIDAKQFTVVPKKWLQNVDILWERLVNYGINKNKVHICYYSTQENAQIANGEPDPTFAPNFNALRSDRFPCVEGTFLCRIVKYTCKFGEIVQKKIKYIHFEL